MADPPRHPETGADIDVEPDHGTPPRMPRWVKWPGIIIGILVILFLVLRFTGLGGGVHGPGRHLPGGGTPPASVAPGGHAPGGGHR